MATKSRRENLNERYGVKGRVGNLLQYMPYLDIVDGVVFLENGMAEVGVELTLPSVLFASPGRVEGQWRSLRNILHLAVGNGERARFYIEAAPAGPEILEAYRRNVRTSFALAKEIAEARIALLEGLRTSGAILKWRTFMTLAFPVAQKGRVQFAEKEFQEILEVAKNKRDKLVGFLTAGQFLARPLDTQEVFAFMWRWWNPPLAGAKAPTYRPVWDRGGIPGKVASALEVYQGTAKEQVAGTYVLNYSPDVLDVGGLALTAVALYNEPEETFLAALSKVIEDIPRSHLYLVVEYAHTPLDSIIGKLQSDHRKYTALAEGEGMRDVTAKSKLKEVEKAMDTLMESGDQVYETSVGLVLLAQNYREALSLRERAISALSHLPAARPTFGAGLPLRLFTALAPFNGEKSPHRFVLPSSNGADIAPVSLPWEGDPENPTVVYLNRFNALTSINAFDQRAANWNGLIVAGSGSGKTFFSQAYISGLLAQGDAEVIIVDRGGGYIPLVEALGWQEAIIHVEPGTVSINPFDLPPGVNAPSEEKKAFVFAIVRSMVPPSSDPEVAAIEDAILMAAIDQVYKRKTQMVKDPVTGEYQPKYLGAQLSDLVQVLLRLDDIGGRAPTERDKQVAKALATRLQSWTGNTPYGSFVDRPTNIRTDYPVIYFETTGLSRYPALQGPGLLLLADIIWQRAEKDPSVRKLVVMDEVWALLQIPQARGLIVELYRRARRYNTAIYSISQSIMDFAEVRGILQNTTYFFVGQFPTDEEVKDVVRVLGLPESMLEVIRSLRMVRGKFSEWVFYTVVEGRPEGEIIRVEPSKVEYWIYTTNPKDLAQRKALTEKGLSIVEAAKILAGRNP